MSFSACKLLVGVFFLVVLSCPDFKQKHDHQQHKILSGNVSPMKDGNNPSSLVGKAAAIHKIGCYHSLCRGNFKSTGNSEAEKRDLCSHRWRLIESLRSKTPSNTHLIVFNICGSLTTEISWPHILCHPQVPSPVLLCRR